MTKILFEQDYITELYGHEREEKGRKEGYQEVMLNCIRSVMRNLNFSLTEAMNALDISKEEQNAYIELFENSEKKEVKV